MNKIKHWLFVFGILKPKWKVVRCMQVDTPFVYRTYQEASHRSDQLQRSAKGVFYGVLPYDS